MKLKNVEENHVSGVWALQLMIFWAGLLQE
jgi:hypothetical protein